MATRKDSGSEFVDVRVLPVAINTAGTPTTPALHHALNRGRPRGVLDLRRPGQRSQITGRIRPWGAVTVVTDEGAARSIAICEREDLTGHFARWFWSELPPPELERLTATFDAWGYCPHAAPEPVTAEQLAAMQQHADAA
jgi:hypothetical protein